MPAHSRVPPRRGRDSPGCEGPCPRHHDAVGVSAVGDRGRAVLVRAVVGEGRVRAELLEALAAVRAAMVGRDHAADADEVTDLELLTLPPTLVTRPTISWPGTHG